MSDFFNHWWQFRELLMRYGRAWLLLLASSPSVQPRKAAQRIMLLAGQCFSLGLAQTLHVITLRRMHMCCADMLCVSIISAVCLSIGHPAAYPAYVGLTVCLG